MENSRGWHWLRFRGFRWVAKVGKMAGMMWVEMVVLEEMVVEEKVVMVDPEVVVEDLEVMAVVDLEVMVMDLVEMVVVGEGQERGMM